jgi:hypothetical protein
MRRRTLVLLVAAVAIAAAAVAATASAGGPPGGPNTLTLAVYGDAPYLDPAFAALPHAEFQATPAFIDTINADKSIQEVVHVGDIHSGSEPCTKAYDQSIFDLWTAFERPLIYTPGDNEWSDCTKVKEEPGSDNDDPVNHPDLPLENLALIRQIFFANPGLTLGQHPMHVITQAQAFDRQDPTDATYAENVMWRQGKTEFVTLNIPGGSNNDIDPWYAKTQTTPWNPDQQTEMEQRTGADIRWLNAAFAQAERSEAQDVVIIGQSDMWDTTDSPSHQTNYEPIVASMAENASFFKKPVLYLNGDSHIYRSDDPLEQGSTCFTESGACTTDAWNQHPFYDVRNFHRIVVHGSTFPLEWLKLTIDGRPGPIGQPTATSLGALQLGARDPAPADAVVARNLRRAVSAEC